MRVRVRQLLEVLNERVYGKEHVIALSFLSAMAGESIFLFGPPGVAKSMVARRLKLAFRHGAAFEYLMSRFSTPDEIFGPVSISRLKDLDKYERVTEGYLPTADVVFLDEIWKAGPAIQNALLTVINEKVYRNGNNLLRIPLKGLIAASNELPAQGQGLEALYDRFLIRLLVGGVEDVSDFDRMVLSSDESEPVVPEDLPVDREEYAEWQRRISEIKVHYSVLEVIHLLREQIEEYNGRIENDASGVPYLYVSDRRWKKLVRLMRASAFLNGSDTVRLSDCLLLAHCLWGEPDQIDWAAEAVMASVRKSMEGYMLNLASVGRELENLKSELASVSGLNESRDPALQLVDNFYYQIEKARIPGRLLLFADDYQNLNDRGRLFYMHKDKYKTNCYILKKYDPSMRNKVPQSKIYSLRRGCRSVLVNDYEYPLLCVPGGDAVSVSGGISGKAVEEKFIHLDRMLSNVEGSCRDLLDAEQQYCQEHLFLSAKEKEKMVRMLQSQQGAAGRYRNEFEELKHAYRKENQEYPSERPEGGLFGASSR